jgi:KaiC
MRPTASLLVDRLSEIPKQYYLTFLGLALLMVSTGVPSLDAVLNDGYPDRSSILVLGQSGLGKQALGYWLTKSGLVVIPVLAWVYCMYNSVGSLAIRTRVLPT